MSQIEEITIPVPWGQVAAKAWNDPSLEPVLLVHGHLHNAGAFDQLVPMLPEKFYYVCMETPGHGKSSYLFEGLQLNFFDFIIAIDYVADYFKWDKFIFIGHSISGYMGFFYSAFYPDRITKLGVLDDPIRVYTPQTGLANLLQSFAILKEPERAAYDNTTIMPYKAAVQRIITLHPEGLSVGSAHDLAKRGLVECEDGFRFVLDPRLMFFELPRMDVEQMIALLKRIKCPILHIAATDSMENGTMRLLFEDSEDVREMFKRRLGDDYQWHVVEGNHSVHIDYPERVNGFITDFLTQ